MDMGGGWQGGHSWRGSVRTPRFPSRLLNARFPCNTEIRSQNLAYAKTTIDLLLSYASASNTGVLAGGRDLAKGRYKLKGKSQPSYLVGLSCHLVGLSCLLVTLHNHNSQPFVSGYCSLSDSDKKLKRSWRGRQRKRHCGKGGTYTSSSVFCLFNPF